MNGPNLYNVGWNIAVDAYNGMVDALDIHSPSRRTRKLGSFTAEGYVLGMKDYESDIRDETRRMAGIVENEFAPSIGFAANSSYDVKPMVNGIVSGVREALRSGMPQRQGVTVIVNGLSVRETADVDRISERLCQKVVQAERRGLV